MNDAVSLTISDADFTFLKDYLYARSGLSLSVEKRYLLESRLVPVCRKRGYKLFNSLIQELKLGKAPDLERTVVEAMTTNETLFFRDKSPFDLLVNGMLPEIMAVRASTRKIRFWCAAASTGQEPYSLAMTLDSLGAKMAGWKYEIIGTDISIDCLEKAKLGIYNQFEIQRGLPVQMMLKYFKQVGDQWHISESIKSMVQYRPLNLVRDFNALGEFDFIFCRNVLIYFDPQTKRAVLDRMSNLLPAHGALVMGAAETVLGISDKLVPHPRHRGLYCLPAKGERVIPQRVMA
jgi:chemotaxis protein methyltransferase CheR